MNNQLTSLPASIGKLTNLRFLSLSNNQLTQIPESIKSLKKLKRLYLTGNPLSDSAIQALKTWLPNTKIVFKKK
jgi:Leucine-rich repeat (LRR) protein